MKATKSELKRIENIATLVYEYVIKADGHFVEDNISHAKYMAKMLIREIEKIELANKQTN